jgi:hypothetical protein
MLPPQAKPAQPVATGAVRENRMSKGAISACGMAILKDNPEAVLYSAMPWAST